MAIKLNDFEDRVVEYPNRYLDQDGKVYSFQRNEGVVETVGTVLDAETFQPHVEGLKTLSKSNIATSGNESKYTCSIENWQTEENSILYVTFGQASDNTKLAELKINDETSYLIKNKNKVQLSGSEIEFETLLLMFDGEDLIKISSNDNNSSGGKEVGEVGITYFANAPHNCLMFDGDLTLNKEEYSELWSRASIEINRGNNSLFEEINETTFLVKEPRFPASFKSNETWRNETGIQGGNENHRHEYRFGFPYNYGAILGENATGAGAYRYSNNTWSGGEKPGLNASGSRNNSFTSASTSESATLTTYTGDTTLVDNLPPYTTVNYWICYKTSPYTENINDLDRYAIVERGNNSNGSWVKYADGTMECYGNKIETIAIQTANEATGGYRSADNTLNFPQNFIDTNYTIMGNVEKYSALSISLSSYSNSQFSRSYQTISISPSQERIFNYLAIGKWK